jgi:hypothetical protein
VHRVYGNHCSYRHSNFLLVSSLFECLLWSRSFQTSPNQCIQKESKIENLVDCVIYILDCNYRKNDFFQDLRCLLCHYINRVVIIRRL